MRSQARSKASEQLTINTLSVSNKCDMVQVKLTNNQVKVSCYLTNVNLFSYTDTKVTNTISIHFQRMHQYTSAASLKCINAKVCVLV